MKKSKVAVLKTKPETVVHDYEQTMELARFSEALDMHAATIIKDNISWHYPMPGANTTPWQLDGVLSALKKYGFKDICAVENKTVVTRPKYGEKNNNLDRVYKRHNIPVLYNFEPEDITWIRYNPKSTMTVLSRLFPEGIPIPDFFIGKNIIHLPTMKCHIYTTTTGAMKNAFGGLLSTKRHYTHSWIHNTLVDLLKIQKEIHTGIFAVMDGTTAGNGPGPRTLIPVRTDCILAGSDQVAIDAVAARIMGFHPMDIDYIRIADEQGLGNGNTGNIELVGDDISGLNLHFHVGSNLASSFGRLLWFSPFRVLQKLFFRTPLVYLFVLASDLYHDKYWWKRHGEGIFEDWKKTSPWGTLWTQYFHS